MQQLTEFCERHNLTSDYNVSQLVDLALADMELGLKVDGGETTHPDFNQLSLEMLPTWLTPPQQIPENQQVIVIDAGGTNFRSCLLAFGQDSSYEIKYFRQSAMPGADRELTKQEFFEAIASQLDYLKNQSAKIGFCFSYAVKMTENCDGRVLNFAKEIKAKEVIGSLVGASLKEALVVRGWNDQLEIVLVNDTTAALLSGIFAKKAALTAENHSFVGLILGTGINSAYLEHNTIPKITSQASPQVVVCEAGKFDKMMQSDFDKQFDLTTQNPGKYIIEKMIAGGYVGAVASLAVQAACNEGLFSAQAHQILTKIGTFELQDISDFLSNRKNCFDKITAADQRTLRSLFEIFVERMAKLASVIMIASAVKTATSQKLPVVITCEGTTFEKTPNLKHRISEIVGQELSQNHKINFQIITQADAIIIGTAIATLKTN